MQALRALAALSVVLYHVDFIGRGAFGVDLFFVLSGFIMCHVTDVDRQHFLLKRLIRIVPLYWAGTIAVFALALAFPRLLQTTSDSWIGLLKSLFFIPYDKGTGRVYPVLFLGWTLNYEMFFYIVFSIALAIRPVLAPFISAGLLGVIVLAGLVINVHSVEWAFYTSPMLLEFVLGITLYLVWRRKRGAWTNGSLVVPLIAVIGAGTVFLGLSAVESPNRFILWGIPAVLTLGAVLCLETRFLFPAFIIAVGDGSFSLYLLHPYLLKATEKAIVTLDTLTGKSLFAAAVYLIAAVAMALVTYRLFERPVMKYLRARYAAQADVKLGHVSQRSTPIAQL